MYQAGQGSNLSPKGPGILSTFDFKLEHMQIQADQDTHMWQCVSLPYVLQDVFEETQYHNN